MKCSNEKCFEGAKLVYILTRWEKHMEELQTLLHAVSFKVKKQWTYEYQRKTKSDGKTANIRLKLLNTGLLKYTFFLTSSGWVYKSLSIQLEGKGSKNLKFGTWWFVLSKLSKIIKSQSIR